MGLIYVMWYHVNCLQLFMFKPFSSYVHKAYNLWIVFLFLCVLYEILYRPYSKGRGFKMNCTRKYFEMLIFKALSWFTTLLISIICCMIPLIPLYLIMVNLDINVPLSDLFDATNCCSKCKKLFTLYRSRNWTLNIFNNFTLYNHETHLIKMFLFFIRCLCIKHIFIGRHIIIGWLRRFLDSNSQI